MPSAERSVGWGHSRHISRRSFVIGSAAAVTVGGGAAAAVITSARDDGATAASTLRPICMAMHIHASASEGPGSMEAQLTQAARSGVDVLWWTEHDHRMSGHAAPTEIRFTGLTEQPAATAPWSWQAMTTGGMRHIEHTFASTASHPEIADRDTAVLMSAQGSGAAVATHRLTGQAEDLLNRTSLAAMTIEIDVHPLEASANGFLALEIVTSYRPQRAGVPAGYYVLSYRFGGAQPPGTSKILSQTTAAISLAAPADRWSRFSFDPQADLERLWPGVAGQDAALFTLSVLATSRQATAIRGYFANLRFHRADQGQLPWQRQRMLIDHYREQFPTVQQLQALEVSLTTPHLGWYGGAITLPDSTHLPVLASLDPKVATAAVAKIHSSGGLASYCHPFGTSVGELPAADQEKARIAKSAELIGNRALGCELLEVGYRLRGGCTLEQHESVWDNCSRNAIFLTGLGASDDHKGMDWINDPLNFVTWAWSTDSTQASLLTALRRGNAYFGDLAQFRGQLDIRLDGQAAMGAVSISTAKHRRLTVLATGLPAGGQLDVLRGTVDLAGPHDTTPEIELSTIAAGDLDSASLATVTIDTSRSRFVRLVMRNSQGLAIAFSNPVWLLRSSVAQIPAARRLH